MNQNHERTTKGILYADHVEVEEMARLASRRGIVGKAADFARCSAPGREPANMTEAIAHWESFLLEEVAWQRSNRYPMI